MVALGAPTLADAGAAAQSAPPGVDRRFALIPGAEIGIAKPIGTAANLFSTATDLQVSVALTRGGSCWRLPISLDWRRVVDPSPAGGVWFVGGWAHPEVTFLGRGIGSIGVGWQWRHIEIDGASSTRGSLSAMSSLGVRFHPRATIEITALARYDFAQPIEGEVFRVQYLGVALSLGVIPRRR